MLRIIIAAVVISIVGTLWCNSPSPRPHAKGKFVTATALNVRDKPSTSANIVGKLIRGTSVNALSEQDGWFQILYGQDTAWVHGDFVGTIEDVKKAERETKREASRLADAARTPAPKPKSAIEKKAEAEKVAIKTEKQKEAKRNDLSQTSEPKISNSLSSQRTQSNCLRCTWSFIRSRMILSSIRSDLESVVAFTTGGYKLKSFRGRRSLKPFGKSNWYLGIFLYLARHTGRAKANRLNTPKQ